MLNNFIGLRLLRSWKGGTCLFLNKVIFNGFFKCQVKQGYKFGGKLKCRLRVFVSNLGFTLTALTCPTDFYNSPYLTRASLVLPNQPSGVLPTQTSLVLTTQPSLVLPKQPSIVLPAQPSLVLHSQPSLVLPTDCI